MSIKLPFCFFFVFISLALYSQELSVQQKAWLFKITKKTASLNRNWSPFFTYRGGYWDSGKSLGVDKRLGDEEAAYWDFIENSILEHPELLEVDWEAISKTSPGLLSTAAVKLALWELYSELGMGYLQSPPFSKKEYIKVIFDEMLEVMPAKMKKGRVVREKYMPIFYDIINPSLGFSRKLASLEKVKNLRPEEKENVFNRWHQLISTHVDKKSAFYFQLLLRREAYFKGTLLAVGDGSGSSGLLYERESKEESAEMNTGTGKGIGLFTYQTKWNKGVIMPDYRTEIDMKGLPKEATFLHLTLWGMDWIKHPLVVVEKGGKSYLLFGGPEFSPDPDRVEGQSYYDRIVDYKKRKVDRVLNELNKDGGLLEIYRREEHIRDMIQGQMDSINLEVDSLRKFDPTMETAIQNKLFKNSVHLSNLTDKERRLRDLQEKINAKYMAVARAEKELEKMYAALGENIQSWTAQDAVYTFEDGSKYYFKTQDLWLVQDSVDNNSLKVRLLAASYSIYSDAKDEVQLYVNVTGGVSQYLKDMEGRSTSSYIPDTLISTSYYFQPNEYQAISFFSTEESRIIAALRDSSRWKEKQFRFHLVANGVDSIHHPLLHEDRKDYHLKKNLYRYKNARRVDIQVIEYEKEVRISISGFTDAGRTSMLELSKEQRRKWSELSSSEQSFNPALSALRVRSVVKEVHDLSGISIESEQIVCLPLRKHIALDAY